MNIQLIGDIGNCYGGLSVKEAGGRYYWSIEDWDGHDWEEITKSLYNALLRFKKNGTPT